MGYRQKSSVQEMLSDENWGGGPLRRSNSLKLLSIIFAFTLFAGACSGDNDDSDSGIISDNSILGEDRPEQSSDSTSGSEPVDNDDDHDQSDDDGHDHSGGEDHSDEVAGTAADSLNGDGAELWESIVDGGTVVADNSLEPILITLINIERASQGSFPEIREGIEAAVRTVNETMGGMNGRPVELESCVDGLDPNEAVACANSVTDTRPQLHIQGIDFFNPLLWPTLTGAGLAIMQTVPIFVEDFNTPGIISTEGGCASAFPSAMQYGVETLAADKYVILYSDTEPGLVCYEDTGERMLQQLTDEGAIAREDWTGIPDVPGDPSDTDAVTQQILEFVDGSDNAWIYLGLQASDCNEVLSSLSSKGYNGGVVASGSCRDDSVTSNPASAGVHFGSSCCIPDRPDLWDPYTTKYNEWRNASIDRYGPTAPKSNFMEVGHDVLIAGIIQMTRFIEAGGDIDNDPEGFSNFLATQDNMNRPGIAIPLDCTTNNNEFISVCQKSSGYYIWSGPGGQFEYGPLGEELLDATDLILRAAESNPRSAVN
tara:strand:+ start:4226 stop:5848 length:1623 start_codon:yes stop_codon:yes gene_type:complete